MIRLPARHLHRTRLTELECGIWGVDDVHTHIAQGATAKVESLSPLGRVVFIFEIWAGSCRAQPQVPIKRLGNRVGAGIGCPVIAPALIRPRIHLADFADNALLQKINSHPVRIGRVTLNPHLRDQVLFLSKRCQFVSLGNFVRQRLLTVDRLAHIHRHQSSGIMSMIRGGDHHPVNLVAERTQHLTVIRKTRGVLVG